MTLPRPFPAAPRLLPLGVALLGVLLPGPTGPRPLQGQEEPEATRPGLEMPPSDTVDTAITPGNAFLRGLLIPGWGHASIGSYTRGGFYFLTETATLWAFLRTRRRLAAAEGIRDFREEIVEERLIAGGIEDPLELEEAISADEGVAEARGLVRAREQQREDWLALGIFLVFLGGADAFVSAHLQDFPQPVQIGAASTGRQVEVTFRIPLGGGR